VLPSSDLHVQRDSIVSITYDRKKPDYTLYVTGFYDLVRNRSTFTAITRNSAQFVNLPEVSIFGATVDGQWFPLEPVALRGSATVTHAWDRSTGHAMPYKPAIEGWASAAYLILPKLSFTVQEQFTGKRFISTRTVETVNPFIQTILRLDAQVGAGVLFFKVANLFDVGAYDFPGFPYQGRSFWVGYTLGAAAL
jgi:hypothetical protein